MLQQQVYILTNILMILDGLMVICAGYTAYYISYYYHGQEWSMATDMFSVSILVIMFINNYMLGKFGLYDDRKPPSAMKLIASITQSIVINFSILSVVIFVLKQFEYSRSFFVVFAAATFLFLTIERLFFSLYYTHFSQKTQYSRKIFIVGSKERGLLVSDLLSQQLSWGHEVVGNLALETEESDACSVDNRIQDFQKTLKTRTVDEVIFAIDQSQHVPLSPYLDHCKQIGVAVRILPSMWESTDTSISVERCQDVPFLIIRAGSINATGLLYKRVLDIIGGVVGTIIFLILFPFIGMAIKLESPGPIIFSHNRMGQNGRIFKLLKFRSMFQDAEEKKEELLDDNEMNGAIFKMKDDPRITRVGAWLRKTSLDEVPQFINVLKGEMSLVGTRPPTLNEVEKYKISQLRRISIKPGITGLWQISGRNQITDFDQIVNLDCKYFDNWRFFDDIKIIAKTVYVVLRRKGAI